MAMFVTGSASSTGSFGSIHTAGNVGIGTTSPATTLQIGEVGVAGIDVRIINDTALNPTALQIRNKDNISYGADLGI